MPEAAANGANSAELTELRELLIGSELERISGVEERVADPRKRSVDVAQVLPDAVRGAKAKALRDALEPIFEKAFQNSVRRNPKELADAIYPIIGPAIRTSIAAAIREFAETLNQIVEKSASFRAIRWRIESLVTGKPFSEILLARSLLYSVEQVFLIHRKSGLLLQHVAAQGSVLKDADMISGMLTAIQDFLSDSFVEGGQELETVDAGRFKLWITHSSKVLLVGAVSGTAPAQLRQVFRKALDQIEGSLSAEINSFQDDPSVFDPARPFLEACLLGQSAPEKRKKARLWPSLAGAAALLALLIGYEVRERSRWNEYFGVLKQQPGIVITNIERRGSSWIVEGLRDPKAVDPSDLARARGLDARKISYAWQPYLSLGTQFAAERALEADKDLIERQIIRFELGSSKLMLSESDRVDDLAAAMARLLRARPLARIAVTGHTDEAGSAETNERLSLERARNMIEALSAQGVVESRLDAMGAGDLQPLRTGGSEWDRAANRSVSFRVSGFTERP
jgi:outer membrane protein OmpA-like peptidoglycan-associated protein